MANSSELLHFLKSDRHVTSFSLQAQDILAEAVHLAFKQLVLCLQQDLKSVCPQVIGITAIMMGINQIIRSKMIR